MSRRADLFDLTNVSPLCVSRAAWLSRGKSGECDGDAANASSFPFTVSPTAEVYAARRSHDVNDENPVSSSDAGRKPATTCVAVVKSVSTTSAGTEVRVVVPEVKKRDDDDAVIDDDDDDGRIVEEEDKNAIFEARLRAAMDAESKGVSLDRMFGAKGGVQNSPIRTSVVVQEEEEVPMPSSSPIPAESPVIDAMDIDANAPVFIAEAASPEAVCAAVPEPEDDLSASDAAFERMLAKAMTKPETPVEKQPLDRAVPKKTFEPKLLVKSPEKYEPVVKPTVAASSLDFEAKLEAALRAAEAGGDLTAILSEPSKKTMHSPAGTKDSAESRVNYRELGFTRAEREHHRLHVAEEERSDA